MHPRFQSLTQPRAITMWDFSWLERRWSGAGQEDWDQSLDELMERGYDAVRIDAYPHFVAQDSTKSWEITPPWKEQMWGTTSNLNVQVQPNLNDFIRKCKDRDIAVGLSTWFQLDSTGAKFTIGSPLAHAKLWEKTLETIDEAGLLDAILFVDFCNEWPGKGWAPFFKGPKVAGEIRLKWSSLDSLEWMQESVAYLRTKFPQLPLTYSCVGAHQFAEEDVEAVKCLDFLEPHVWMVHANDCELTNRAGFSYEGTTEYERFQLNNTRLIPLYDSDPDYWNERLKMIIDEVVHESNQTQRGLMTTECWGIVDCKDFPGFDWVSLKRMCEYGVRTASASGNWIANATSNFCAPQFVGMWRDIDWHQEMTRVIKSAKLPDFE